MPNVDSSKTHIGTGLASNASKSSVTASPRVASVAHLATREDGCEFSVHQLRRVLRVAPGLPGSQRRRVLEQVNLRVEVTEVRQADADQAVARRPGQRNARA